MPPEDGHKEASHFEIHQLYYGDCLRSYKGLKDSLELGEMLICYSRLRDGLVQECSLYMIIEKFKSVSFIQVLSSWIAPDRYHFAEFLPADSCTSVIDRFSFKNFIDKVILSSRSSP